MSDISPQNAFLTILVFLAVLCIAPSIPGAVATVRGIADELVRWYGELFESPEYVAPSQGKPFFTVEDFDSAMEQSHSLAG